MFAAVATVRCTLEAVARDFEPAVVMGDQARRLVAELAAVRRLTDGLLAKALKRVDDTGAWARGNDRDAAAFAAREMGVTTGEARGMLATAERLVDLSRTDAAVRAGKLSARQAQLIAEAARVNPAAEATPIDAAAQGLTPLKDACTRARDEVEDAAARTRRQHRSRSLRIWTGTDAMVEGRFSLTPEIGGRIKTLVDAGVQRIVHARRAGCDHEPHEAYAADVLADTFLGRNDPATSVKTTMHVVVDHAALVRGDTAAGERCEIPGVGPVSVAWARDVLGDAFLTAVIGNGKDIRTVAHLGRHIRAELRTALIAGCRECDIEGCGHRGYLEIDHSELDYGKGGPTAWWNLTWPCSLHHKRKTAGARLGPPHPQTGKRSFVGAHPADRETDAA